MKKQLWIMIFLSLILTACSNLNGPERHVTIENKTDVEQKVTLIINDKKEETYTVPAHDTKTTTIVGGFKVKDNLGYKYRISFTAENSVCIIDSPKVKKTVINNLQVAVKLLDENAARTALIHMFPWNRLPSFEVCANSFFNNRQDYDFVSDYLKSTEVRETDLLIQLADCLANKNGFVTLQQRFEEYQKRHHVTLPRDQIFPRYQLKNYFDKKIGQSVYDLFPKQMGREQTLQL